MAKKSLIAGGSSVFLFNLTFLKAVVFLGSGWLLFATSVDLYDWSFYICFFFFFIYFFSSVSFLGGLMRGTSLIYSSNPNVTSSINFILS